MNSTGILYIDCPAQEKNDAFSVNKNFTEDEYVKMLREYSTTIGAGISKINSFDKHYNFYENKINKDEIIYSKASVNIYDISGSLCDITELYNIQRNGMGILIIEIDKSKMEDSFESEFKFWKRDSMNINNDKDIDKDERIRFLPIKDLQFEIDNHLFLFSGCKIYCEYTDFKVALIIQNIKEI
jgi:hypothetical protein